MNVACALFGLSCTVFTVGTGNLPHEVTTVIQGKAIVQDGDTIYVQGQAIRLFGVDAEELGEPHGAQAKYALRSIIGQREVSCALMSQSYNRHVAMCSVNGADLAESIISTGYALDCKKYSGGIYAKYETYFGRLKLKRKPYC